MSSVREVADQLALPVQVKQNLNAGSEQTYITSGSFKVRAFSDSSERRAQLSDPPDEASLEKDPAVCEHCEGPDAFLTPWGQLCCSCDRQARRDDDADRWHDGRGER